jgi:hypothetical protein
MIDLVSSIERYGVDMMRTPNSNLKNVKRVNVLQNVNLKNITGGWKGGTAGQINLGGLNKSDANLCPSNALCFEMTRK